MISPTYDDIIELVRAQVAMSGLEIDDQIIYDAIVRTELQVYGAEDWRSTRSPVARLRKRTPFVFDALAAPWVGVPEVSTEAPEPRLESATGATLTPIAQDLHRGIWTFQNVQTDVYIVGTVVDIYAAAVDCLDVEMVRRAEQVTQSSGSGAFQLSHIEANVARARTRLVGKMRNLPTSSGG